MSTGPNLTLEELVEDIRVAYRNGEADDEGNLNMSIDLEHRGREVVIFAERTPTGFKVEFEIDI